MAPTVSILVPVYNRADMLGECLDSLTRQTWTDLEIVVVDGASTDRTWEVCTTYARLDQRVRIFREERNTGPVPGWRRCLDEARGVYGTFVWSDDSVARDFVERTLANLAEDVAFVYTSALIGPSPLAAKVAYRHRPGSFPSELFIRGSLAGLNRFPVSPACAMFRLRDLRTSFVAELPTNPVMRLDATGAGTDALMYLLTATRYPRIQFVDGPLAFFRAHRGSITTDGRAGEVIRGYATARAWFAREHGLLDLESRAIGRYWLQAARRRRLMTFGAAAQDCRSDVSAADVARGVAAVIIDTFAERAATQ